MQRDSAAECEDGRPNADCRMPFFLKISFFLLGPRPNTRAGPNQFSTETVKAHFERPTVSVRFGLPNLGRSLPFSSGRGGKVGKKEEREGRE